MTKLAAMPIYGKNLKKSFYLEPVGGLQRNLVCNIRDIIACINHDLGLTLTYFTVTSNLVTKAV